MEKQLLSKGIIPSVNYHLWKACNYDCKFCFGNFDDVSSNNLRQFEAEKLMHNIVEYGFEKITFSGGEPSLCPFINDLFRIAKNGGMTTMIVTNGTNLTDEWLNSNKLDLDWIALSIDSLKSETNFSSGRFNKESCFKKDDYYHIISKIRKYGYKLKINTVVSKFNKNEDINSFIEIIKPDRWKIMQALPIIGENTDNLNDFDVSSKDFLKFLKRHSNHNIVKENNYDMKGSYVMIDPIGRFFNNINGEHKYSKPINIVGVQRALTEASYCFKKFINRGGVYNWK